jgi:hypothetical protein
LEDPSTLIEAEEAALLEDTLDEGLDDSLEESLEAVLADSAPEDSLTDLSEEDPDGFDEVNHIKSAERLMLEHDLDPDEIEVIDLEEVLDLDALPEPPTGEHA